MNVPKWALAVLVLFAAAGLWGAMRFLASGPTLETQTFELQYLADWEANQLIEPYVWGDRPGAPGSASSISNMLTVRETSDNLEKIQRVLAEYDRPKPTVRLHFQLIEANGSATTDPAIADVETELRKLFRYEGYRLVTEAVVGGTEGSHVEQVVGDGTDQWIVLATIESVRVIGDSGTVQVAAGVRAPGFGAFQTTVNARFGQTLVVGNAQLTRGGGTLILTVRPEVVGG
ncbi:MAG: hypothetical protein PVH40_04995 [Gemmatimonadales bacterium]|jgi:hypothetical protein